MMGKLSFISSGLGEVDIRPAPSFVRTRRLRLLTPVLGLLPEKCLHAHAMSFQRGHEKKLIISCLPTAEKKKKKDGMVLITQHGTPHSGDRGSVTILAVDSVQ